MIFPENHIPLSPILDFFSITLFACAIRQPNELSSMNRHVNTTRTKTLIDKSGLLEQNTVHPSRHMRYIGTKVKKYKTKTNA